MEITVLIPAYNAAQTLEAALVPLAQQTFSGAYEVLVVDDGSTDATPDIVRAQAARDPRFRLLQLPCNSGQTAALQAGMREARGTWIAAHDADDWSTPDRLEIQHRYVQDHRTPFCCHRVRLEPRGVVRPLFWRTRVFPKHLAWGNFLFHGTFFYQRGWAREIGFYEAPERFAQDLDVLLRVCQKLPGIPLGNEVVYHYRNWEGAVTHAQRGRQQEEAASIYHRHGLKQRSPHWHHRLRVLARNLC